MPVYEYYCPDNNRIYQFFAKTLAQGRTIPKCPDNPAYRMEKIVSAFSVVGIARKTEAAAGAADAPAEGGGAPGDDAKMDAAMAAMEREFANVDENDPKAMGRMMRRMAELTGEKIDGEMEEVVRKLEEGADPDSLEEQLGGDEPGADPDDPHGGGVEGPGANPPDEGARPKSGGRRKPGRPPTRDPKLYDYE